MIDLSDIPWGIAFAFIVPATLLILITVDEIRKSKQ